MLCCLGGPYYVVIYSVCGYRWLKSVVIYSVCGGGLANNVVIYSDWRSLGSQDAMCPGWGHFNVS